jgi:hypothetical protein
VTDKDANAVPSNNAVSTASKRISALVMTEPCGINSGKRTYTWSWLLSNKDNWLERSSVPDADIPQLSLASSTKFVN